MRPFVSKNFLAGAHLWLASGVVFALAAAWISWKAATPKGLVPPLAMAFAVLNLPALSTLVYGQQSLLLSLFAAAGYAALVDGRYFTAGLLMVPLSMKPHLYFPLGLAVALSVVCDRKWRLAAGFFALLCPLLAISLMLCPSCFADWIGDLGSSESGALVPQTASMYSVARQASIHWTGTDPGAALAWLPAAVAGVAVVWLRFGRRHPFDWREDYPAFLLAGLLATPYLWTYDMSLVVVPQTVLLARNWGHPSRHRLLLCILVALDVFSLWFHPTPPGPLHAWMPFFWLAMWILFRRQAPSSAFASDSSSRTPVPAAGINAVYQS